MAEPDKLARIKAFLDVLKGEEEYVRTPQLNSLVKSIISLFEIMQESVQKQFTAHEEKLSKKLDAAKALGEDMKAKAARVVGDAQRALTYDKAQMNGRIDDVHARIDPLPTAETVQAMMDAGKGEPETGITVRDLLESLPEGERLSVEAIEGLQKILDELTRRVGQAGSRGVAYSRGQIQAYDLSPVLDGSTKTFTLPAFHHILDVKSTSSPIVFRPTTDYTVDPGAMTLTFTSQIDAPSTLAAGQSLLVLYAEI